MIHLVATAVKHGRGGISTALIGFCESPKLQAAGLNVIESHTGQLSKWAAYRAAARRLRHEVQPHDVVWLHCARWFSMLRKYLLARVAKRRGARVVFQFHSAVTANYLASPWYRWWLKRMLGTADGICVLTPWWRQQFIEQLKYPSARIQVVPNPLDAAFSQAAQAARATTTTAPSSATQPVTVQLLCMTRFVEGKNVDAVVSAVALLPQRYRLTLAGEGPQLSTLQRQVTAQGLDDRVEFSGWVDYAAKQEVLARHHLFVLPSQFDSFGMGFIEAMAMGLPVIALQQGATPDVVSDGTTGRLVAQPSPQELATAIQECWQAHEHMSIAARKHALTNFAVDPIVDDLLRYFSKLNT